MSGWISSVFCSYTHIMAYLGSIDKVAQSVTQLTLQILGEIAVQPFGYENTSNMCIGIELSPDHIHIVGDGGHTFQWQGFGYQRDNYIRLGGDGIEGHQT